ncbi:phospholipid/cholesterol/gamma-HCH transport system substrate-binding protein [Rhodovulum sulfidophilum]|uniref:outer membrane lipid asymmetry maintenance protein MlaD n=1 Tax=Rhodovulum sulfidophilum TaxID=35806 RepID=UPI0005A6354A|nr:outer membrane lipid asymmetry maintenance protein MlaD [Rhodovulum sulfidophilum]ANB33997.1 outer membrane lipid asymmetry maintenance protein MlaD [Rhodovulum sulfidophilum DSM 1374]ANB37819.1 outer membrane lipid asymmetry maintenance protein MlaD [Rhodovulum sulfidophilum]MCW2304215.1 phospholipid/cholesterol/gamma-HCH transport system substrate-binding protein [Rhodovulum sulfidophilum]
MAENSPTEILTGAAVLALAAGFFVYASNATGMIGGAGQQHYELSASFRSAEGVNLGTDVRLAGVKVGTVTGLELNPQTFRADTRFTVRNGIEIPDDSTASVSSEGLLGGTFLELVPGGSPFNLEPGAEVIDTQGAVGLISLLMKFVGGGGDGGGSDVGTGGGDDTK